MKTNQNNTLLASCDASASPWKWRTSNLEPNARKMSNLKAPDQVAFSMKRCLMALLFSLSLFGANGLLLAQKTSIASGNWSNPAIWSPAGVPTTGQNVVIAAGHTVTLGSPVNIGNGSLTVDGTLDRANRNFTAGSLSGASTGVITATNGILTIGSNNASTTYAGKLSGNLPTAGRAIRKTGSGTLTLTGQSDFAAPFNSQAVFVNAGTLKLGVSNALPAGSYLAVSAGATFDLNGFNQTLAAASSFSSTSSPIPAVLTNSAITASALTIDMPAGGDGFSWDATMTGNINLVVNGSDITNSWYWLSGPGIAFNGNTSVTGTATLGLGAALNGDLSVNAGSKLALYANSSSNKLTLGGVLQSAGTHGNTASSASFKNNTYFDNSDASFANVLTVATGASVGGNKISIATGDWSNPAIWSPYGVPALNDNVTVSVNDVVTLTAPVVIDGNGFGTRLNVRGTLNTGVHNLTVNGQIAAGTSVNTAPNGRINTGLGSVVTENWQGSQQTWLVITGPGGYTRLKGGSTAGPESILLPFTHFNQNQTYTGPTTIGEGAQVGIGQNNPTGNLSSAEIINNGRLVFNITADITLAANISGTGSVQKWRASTVTLTGNNTYTGSTRIGNLFISGVGGTLAIANTSALSPSTDLIFASITAGKLQLNADATCKSLRYADIAQPAGSYGSTLSAATNKNNNYFSGTKVLNVTGGLQKITIASGNWNNPAIWSPVGVPELIDNVTIAVNHTVNMTAPVVIDGNGFLIRLNVRGALNTGVHNLTVNGQIAAGTSVNTAPNGRINTGLGSVVTENWHGSQQTFIVITGPGGYTRLKGSSTAGPESTLLPFTHFNQNQTYTGPTTIGEGAQVGIGQNNPTGNLSSTDIINNGRLVLNITADITLASNISGTGRVEKWRASTVTLTGNNTYTGETWIGSSVSTTAGTLAIANASALPASTHLIFFSATAGKLRLISNASCNQLTFAGVLQSSGTYGNTSSSATNKNDTYFDNSNPLFANVLNVASSSPRFAFDQNDGVKEFGVFPNPSSGQFFISVPGTFGQEAITLQVFNIAGKLISSRTVKAVAGTEMISLEDQPNGIYMLNIQTAGVQKTFRLVKN